PSGELDGMPTLLDGRDTTKTVETNLVILRRSLFHAILDLTSVLTTSLLLDAVDPTYDLDILFEVPHYDTHHETNMLNHIVQETKYSKHLVSNNNSYDELKSDNNVISYADYMVTIENDVAQSVPPLEQDNVMILSVIEQMQKSSRTMQQGKSKD
ncbi:hypothetical protein Tco_1414698, partial [Tanacetum coccineum]